MRRAGSIIVRNSTSSSSSNGSTGTIFRVAPGRRRPHPLVRPLSRCVTTLANHPCSKSSWGEQGRPTLIQGQYPLPQRRLCLSSDAVTSSSSSSSLQTKSMEDVLRLTTKRVMDHPIGSMSSPCHSNSWTGWFKKPKLLLVPPLRKVSPNSFGQTYST
jgi:hypothetical protein